MWISASKKLPLRTAVLSFLMLTLQNSLWSPSQNDLISIIALSHFAPITSRYFFICTAVKKSCLLNLCWLLKLVWMLIYAFQKLYPDLLTSYLNSVSWRSFYILVEDTSSGTRLAIWVWILCLPLVRCVFLGKLINLFVSQFTHL